jgi:quercetin dioxygenase-like cupin family protein
MCMVCDGLTRRDMMSASLAAATAALAAGAAGAQAFTGPTEPRGIDARDLGFVPLGSEFPAIPQMNGRQLRMRLWTIAPGGVIPVHSHADRPALIFFMEGEIVEHRDDRPDPVTHRAGEVSKEAGGVSHWWENRGSVPVKLVAADVFNAEPERNGTPASAQRSDGC